jgi:thiamine-phosphate pyrophosphorylase
MCLTQDALPWSHAEQARRLCAGGARWVQLRMKDAPSDRWLATAREVVRICHDFSAICIVNDNVEIALASGADGVHLGKLDQEWRAARTLLGPEKILGGTINNLEDVERAKAAGCLDYVGVGPWRFTSNKKNLAPLLGQSGVQRLIKALGNLPAWIIGGVEIADVPTARSVGAAGVAVSSALYRDGQIETHVKNFLTAWPTAYLPGSAGGSPAVFLNRAEGSR